MDHGTIHPPVRRRKYGVAGLSPANPNPAIRSGPATGERALGLAVLRVEARALEACDLLADAIDVGARDFALVIDEGAGRVEIQIAGKPLEIDALTRSQEVEALGQIQRTGLNER